MNRLPICPIVLSLAILLSACVPIPATPPETTAPVSNPTPDPATETKAGYSDLASGLAKADKSDDIQPYAQLLDEFAACMQADVTNEEESPGILRKRESRHVDLLRRHVVDGAILHAAVRRGVDRKCHCRRRNRRRTVSLRNARNGAHRLPAKRIGIKEEDRQFANPSPAILPIPSSPKSCKS